MYGVGRHCHLRSFDKMWQDGVTMHLTTDFRETWHTELLDRACSMHSFFPKPEAILTWANSTQIPPKQLIV